MVAVTQMRFVPTNNSTIPEHVSAKLDTPTLAALPMFCVQTTATSTTVDVSRIQCARTTRLQAPSNVHAKRVSPTLEQGPW
ncbi:unnamed protein product [Rotaria sp. Silwood1]|nr:unnamed protein product [Rotaria sp. Silwood1]